MGVKVLDPPSDAQALVRTAAFQLLLRDARPTTSGQIATVTGLRTERVEELVVELHGMGRIRRLAAGEIIGSAGLSVIPDRHEIDIEGRRFWTWCAYDILGIFGALRADGYARSPSPAGKTIEVRFSGGRPEDNGAVLFRPDDDLLGACDSVYEDWCPNSNLFSNAREAESWVAKHALRGRIMGLAEASDLGTLGWADVVSWRPIGTDAV